MLNPQRVSLWVEGGETSTESDITIKLNYHILDGISVGDLVEVVPLLPLSSVTHGARPGQGLRSTPKRWTNGPGLLFQVALLPPDVLAKQPTLQLAIPYSAAKVFDLEKHNRGEVLLRKLPSPVPPEYCADHIELFFKDQYIGRGEMWRIIVSLANSSAYIGREVGLPALRIRAKIGRIYVGGKRVFSGFITPFTNIVFRSESAKYYIFVQVSSEMWHFEEDGSLYHEKALLFLEDLFNRWTKVGTNHIVSIVLFARVFYTREEARKVPPPVLQLEDGRHYKDFYKVITDLESTIQWQRVLASVREQLAKFQYHALTYLLQGTNDPTDRQIAGHISAAHLGNILEAMGIACNAFDEHCLDCDLRRTGVSIVFVTAGTCVYDVDQMLLRLTTERMITLGIGVDFVSLAKMPLHVVPLFRFSAVDPDAEDSDGRHAPRTLTALLNPVYIDARSPDAKRTTYYNVPFFVDCSFFSRHQDRPFRIDRFMPRCRMSQIHNGIGEHDLNGIQIPLLSGEMPASAYGDDAVKRHLARQQLDAATVGAPVGWAKKRDPTARGARITGGTPLVTSSATNQARTPGSHSDPVPIPDQGIPGSSMHQTSSYYTPTKEKQTAVKKESPAATALRRTASSSANSSPTKERGRPGQTPATPTLITRLSNLAQTNRTPPAKSTPLAGSSLSQLFSWPKAEASTGAGTVIVQRVTASVRPGGTHLKELMVPSPEPMIIFPQRGAKSRESSVSRLSVASAASRTKPIAIKGGSSREASRGTTSTERGPPQMERFNPSNPKPPSQFLLSQMRRWSAIFPRASNDQRSLKWKSLTTPGCLPIATDFSPPQHELESLYDIFEYSLPVSSSSWLVKVQQGSSPQETLDRAAAACLREAVSQRLSQGFQLVLPRLMAHSHGEPHDSRPFADSLVGLMTEAEKGEGAHVDLSLSDHYHRLSISGLQSPQPLLHVKLFIQRRDWRTDPQIYRPAIWWSSEQNRWEEFRIRFDFPDLDAYDFRGLDHIIAGIDRGVPLNSGLRYSRTRVAFLPGPITRRDFLPRDSIDASSTDEMIRLSGMLKMQTSLQNMTWKPPGEAIIQGPSLDFTTSDAAQYVRQESDRLVAIATAQKDQRERAGQILRDTTPEAVVEAMLHPLHGVDVRTRRWGLRSYEDVFVGEQMVTWLKHQLELHTREEALGFAVSLHKRGLFRALSGAKTFLDAFTYYEILPPWAPPKIQRTGWFGGSDKSSRLGRLSTPSHTRSRSRSRPPAPERPRVEMTKVCIVELDPGNRSDRSKKAVMHCDISHSASNAWHVELQWLGISSALVDNLLQGWSRLVDRYGIKMVEQNVRSLSHVGECSPLQQVFAFKLAAPPPRWEDYTDKVPNSTSAQNYFEGQLMRRHGFVLDVEADANFPQDVEVVYSYHRSPAERSQFIHSSGVAVAAVQDSAVTWADNLALRSRRAHPAHAHAHVHAPSHVHSDGAPDAAGLRHAFAGFCADAERLARFWQGCVRELEEAYDREMSDSAPDL